MFSDSSEVLKFIKDVALYGPTEDLLGGAGELPKEFAELMREKTIVGSAGVLPASYFLFGRRRETG